MQAPGRFADVMRGLEEAIRQARELRVTSAEIASESAVLTVELGETLAALARRRADSARLLEQRRALVRARQQ